MKDRKADFYNLNRRKVLAERKRRKAIEKGELPADTKQQAAHPTAAAGSAEKSQAYHAESSTTTPIEAPPAYEQAVAQR